MAEIRDSDSIKSRLVLIYRFMDDLEEERMPERVKLSIASAGFSKLDTEKDEMNNTLEKERNFDILQQLLPDANLKVFTKPKNEFKVVTRYDPTALTASLHETKVMPKKAKKTLQAKKGENLKGHHGGKNLDIDMNLDIKKGIDKKKVQIDRADRIIQKSIGLFAANSNKDGTMIECQNAALKPKKIKKHMVKEIKKEKWNEIAVQKKDLSGFKLFG